MHNRLDLPDLQPLFRAFADIPVVSISDAQQAPLPFANWCGTVYHGLPLDLYPFRPKRGKYLAFLGRVSPEKGVAPRCGDRAPPGPAAEDRRQDRRPRSRLLRTAAEATFRGSPMSNSSARSARRRRATFWASRRAAVSHRLARTIRAGDDRIDGLRHAGGGFSPRRCPRGDARWRVRLRGRHASTARSRPRRARSTCRASVAAPTSRDGSRRRGWPTTTWPSTNACWRPERPAGTRAVGWVWSRPRRATAGSRRTPEAETA